MCTAVKNDFSFWKWFVACLNLVRNYVKAEWQKGSVTFVILLLESLNEL